MRMRQSSLGFYLYSGRVTTIRAQVGFCTTPVEACTSIGSYLTCNFVWGKHDNTTNPGNDIAMFEKIRLKTYGHCKRLKTVGH